MDIDQIVRQTIEEVTGNNLKDIRPDSDLVEDLGVSQAELVRIISSIQRHLEIMLSKDAQREILDAEYVSDITEIVEEEYEY